ncbi:hypothetical protein GCM10022626_12690 [[Pseudomonas] carboxydohydrogena]
MRGDRKNRHGGRHESDRDQQNQSGRAGRHPEISILWGLAWEKRSMAGQGRQVIEKRVSGGLVIAAILAI